MLSIVKLGWKPEDVVLLKRSKEDVQNVDHIIINHDIATVREFMFCKVRVWKGYFCNWLRKNWLTLTSFHQWTTTKHWIPPPFVPPTRISEKIFPLTCLIWNLAPPLPLPPPPLTKSVFSVIPFSSIGKAVAENLSPDQTILERFVFSFFQNAVKSLIRCIKWLKFDSHLPKKNLLFASLNAL